MKAYHIQLLVVDHDSIGPDAVVDLLTDVKYINPQWLTSSEAEISEWHDGHSLNIGGEEFFKEVKRLFP